MNEDQASIQSAQDEEAKANRRFAAWLRKQVRREQ